MTWEELQRIFNRAISLTLGYKKLLMTFSALAVIGLAVVTCRSIATHSSGWAMMSLLFLPLFFGAAVLMAIGVVIVRLYHDEVKERPVDHKQVMMNSWQLMASASYFALPVILLFLLVWMALAIFYLFTEIPYLGDVLSVVLAFWPYLLNVSLLLLVVASVGMLFFVIPLVALRGLDRVKLAQAVVERLLADPFSSLVQLLIALLPVGLSALILSIAGCLTSAMGFGGTQPLQSALHWFFIMIPFTALLAPGVIFFFNFSVEAHVLAQRHLRQSNS